MNSVSGCKRFARAATRLRALWVAALFLAAVPLVAQRGNGDERIAEEPPLQAELLTPLDAARSSQVIPVLAKSLHDWRVPGCVLRRGATIAGVADGGAVDKSAKVASLQLRFKKADCNGAQGAEFTTRLYALIAKPDTSSERVFADQGGLFGSFSPRPPLGPGGGATGPVHRADLSTDMTVTSVPTGPALPRVLHAGDVFGLKHITLETAPQSATVTVRETNTKSLRLEAGTKLILVAFREAPRTLLAKNAEADAGPVKADITVKAANANQAASAPAVPAPVDLTTVCTTSCVVEAAMPASPGLAAAEGATLSMAALGYSRKGQRVFHRFAHSFSLEYLDRDHLLFTFDLHSMRKRISDAPRPQYIHTVRAVVVDARQRTVTRVRDWQVIGEERYVWPGPPGTVLAHIGSELILLGPDLEPRKRFAVADPLAWVSTSPGSDVFAVGTVRERHTADVHRQLSEASLLEPEEDIDVTFLKSDLEVLGTARQPSTVSEPVLSSQGEIRVVPAKHRQWTVEEFTWAAKRRTIATVSSDCLPELSLPTRNLIFFTGCTEGQSWYRAMRPDGHTVLRGEASSQALEIAAEGNATDDAFAVRVVRSAISNGLAQRVSSSDLRGELVSVYRASDGKRLLSSYMDAVPLSEQSFALAPGSHELAVLGLDNVRLFAPGSEQ